MAFADKNGERKGSPDAIDRRHEGADRRLAAKVRAKPKAPDWRAVTTGYVVLLPAVPLLLLGCGSAATS